MSVISQGKLLFCEGKPSSLDYAISVSSAVICDSDKQIGFFPRLDHF
jgi:hypothetical protein